MRVDLDIDAEPLDGLPRFQRSLTLAKPLVLLTWLPALMALLLWAVAYLVGLFSTDSHWIALLDVNAASLVLLAASAQSAWWIARWRATAIGQHVMPLRFWQRDGAQVSEAEPISGYERWLESVVSACRRQVQRIGGESLWLFGLAGLALLMVNSAWRLDLPVPAVAGQLTWVVVGVLVISAFFLVVVERHLVAETEATCPEAESLAAMLRLVIVVQLLTVACLVLVDGQRLWPARLAVLIGLLPGLAAAELLLRALLSVFSPRRSRQEPTLVARCLVAGSLQWPPRPLAFIQGELQQRLGIDLRQVWAFDFMRRAFLPVAALVLLAGWLLTGVVEVPMSGRGVYERFGNPVQVYQPGLHVGLPWPFGKVLSVDNGVIRELATTGSDSTSEPLSPAEGPAPAVANRLWDATHLSENSQVIAGIDGGRQSFQIVNMDVRFIYRIGLSDKAALAATYHSTDVAQLLRSIANRVLVHDFAGRSLDGVLGAEREALGRDIGHAVQADLDRLDSGVELLATSVEAIHPPAGAANAYHAVQAAQITAQALIARDRGLAAQQANIAQLNATTLTDKATADANETTSKARIVELRFAAERSAWQRAGQAFVLEQYLGRLSQGLNGANSLIIDHRLAAGQAPTLDLRGYAAPGAPSLGFP